MKRIAVILLCIVLCLSLLCSCTVLREYLPVFSQNEHSRTQCTALPDGASHDGYYYNKLTAAQQSAYDALLCGAWAHESRVYLPVLTEKELSDVFQSVYYDNPGLVCLENKFGWGTFGDTTFIELQYSESAEVCAQKSAEIKAAVSESETVLTAEMDDFEKELALHDWLAARCAYSSDSSSPYTAYGALIEGTAVCEGYAKAMQLLLDNAGIKSRLVTGQTKIDGQPQGHMWNIVEVGGKSYHLDVTWDAPQNEDDLIQHTYFNLSDEEISSDHSGFDENESRCTAITENYFRRAELLFDDYDDLCTEIERVLPETVKNKNGILEFRLASAELYERVIKKLFDDGEIYDIIERVNLPDCSTEQVAVKYISSPTQQTVLLTIA